MTRDEIEAFIADSSKLLVGDIELNNAGGNGSQFKFRGPVQHSDSDNRRIEVNIWHNSSTPTLKIAYFVPGIDRIYGICLGVSHNKMPYHRHHGRKDSEIISPLPDSIARLVDDPATAWAQFCAETSLTHIGDFRNLPEEPWRPQATEI